MNPNSTRLQQRALQEAQQEHEHASQQEQAVREFAEVEDLLRHDLAQTPLPLALEERLKLSVDAVEPHRQPWWRRFFRA